MAEKKDDDKSLPAFSLDPDTGHMPSVTRLLDRKTLSETNSSIATPKPAPPPARPPAKPTLKAAPPPVQPPAPAPEAAPERAASVPVEEIGINISSGAGFELEQRAEPAPQTQDQENPSSEASPDGLAEAHAAPQLLALTRRVERRVAVADLVQWQMHGLRTGKDPLGKGIALLMDKGATSALFLAAITPPPGSPVPHFNATATFGAGSKLSLWTGLKWDPVLTPDTWNKFVHAGYVELSPPGTTTNMKSARNIIRAAFGITHEEWLLLVRIGSAQICRGVLVLTSKASLVGELPAALPLLTANFAPAKAA